MKRLVRGDFLALRNRALRKRVEALPGAKEQKLIVLHDYLGSGEGYAVPGKEKNLSKEEYEAWYAGLPENTTVYVLELKCNLSDVDGRCPPACKHRGEGCEPHE
jgi:hypothetical protein